jgi:penicillin amidase
MSRRQELIAVSAHQSLMALGRVRQARPSGRYRLPGLGHPVEIRWDRWGVPHIYAATIRDLFFAQGYTHAALRRWQMEFHRRAASGRLAEILGKRALDADRAFRVLGLRRAAEVDLKGLSPEEHAELAAYAAGVNAFAAKGPRPVEFLILAIRHEPWNPVDSLAWGKLMAWALGGNWEAELMRAALVDALGPAGAAGLEAPPPARWPTILGDGPGGTWSPGAGARDDIGAPAPPPRGAPPVARASDRAADAPGEGASPGLNLPGGPGSGSNNWVVGGQRTASGAPLLANDMHLSLTAPAIWFENHLVCDDPADPLDATGVTFPGVPGIVAGHNGGVAWGFTNSFADAQDLYLEHLRPGGHTGVEYEFENRWHPAEVHRERIAVRGGSPETLEVVVTRHGPIVNSLAPGLAGEEPLALRWTAHEPEASVRSIRRMMRAEGCAELREALRTWSSPAQNVVYADTVGNIGYTLAGRLPVRPAGDDGRTPVPGWTGEHEWKGFVPFEAQPHAWNPACGYIVTANNRVTAQGHPDGVPGDYAGGDRAQRIVELISSRDMLDVAALRRMHFDQVSPTGRDFAKRLAALPRDDATLAPVIDLMASWDGTLDAGSQAAAVYELYQRVLLRMLAGPRTGPLADRYMGKGPSQAVMPASMMKERAMEWLLAALDDPEGRAFDLGGGETRDQVMPAALQETLAILAGRLGPYEGWNWGSLHTVTFAHVLGQAYPLARHFSRGPFPVGGDGSTIWATGSGLSPAESSAVVGPPYRFIADLGDLRRSVALLAPGNSGIPSDIHYADQADAWFSGGYHPMLYAREDVVRETASIWTLAPGA